MSVDIRSITADEATAFRRAVRHGFMNAEVVDDEQFARDVFDPPERCFVAVDGPEFVATYASFPTELTVPGGATVPVGAVTAVTCRATHRRQGILTRIIGRDLAESRERGEVADVLIAAEYPIYGRFGYGPATRGTTWELDAAMARFSYAGEGTIHVVDAATYRKEAPGVFERVRAARPGMIGRDQVMWDLLADIRRWPEAKPWMGFRLLCSDADGTTQGYARYSVDDAWRDKRPHVTLTLNELGAATPAADARLWSYLSQMDWVTTVKAADRPPDEVLPWLVVDGRHAKQASCYDFVWVRPLDVAGLLTTRSYEATGHVVIEVADELGLAEGRFALDASPDGATCTPSTATAELTLPVSALGAACLGDVRLEVLHRAGRLDEHAAGAVGRAAGILHGEVAPWCNTWF